MNTGHSGMLLRYELSSCPAYIPPLGPAKGHRRDRRTCRHQAPHSGHRRRLHTDSVARYSGSFALRLRPLRRTTGNKRVTSTRNDERPPAMGGRYRDSDGLLGSGGRDSNPRHSAWKADTLPTELPPHGADGPLHGTVSVGVIGLEPTTSASQTPRATNCATPRSEPAPKYRRAGPDQQRAALPCPVARRRLPCRYETGSIWARCSFPLKST